MLAQGFAAKVDNRAYLGEPGVVDQHIQPSLPLFNGGHCGGDTVVVIDIQLQRCNPQLRQRREALGTPGRSVYLVSAVMKLRGHGSANPTGATGDKDGTRHGMLSFLVTRRVKGS